MSRSASASQRPRPRMACCRHGPRSPAASARIQPVLRRSGPSSPSRNPPADAATRSCVNKRRIRTLASRSDDAHSSSVVSIDAPLTVSPSAKVSNASGQQKCSCNASVMGLRVSSPSSAVLQRVTSSPWSYLDVQHRSADTWADRRAPRRDTMIYAVRDLLFGHNLQIGSSPSYLSPAPPVSCFRPWSAQGRHTMRSEKEAVGQSRARGSPERAPTALLPASLPPASRRRDLGRASPTSPACPKLGQPHSLRRAAAAVTSSALRGSSRLLAPAELAAVHPHAVQNAGQLARQRHLGSLEAAPLGHLQGPVLEPGEAYRAAQHGVGVRGSASDRRAQCAPSRRQPC